MSLRKIGIIILGIGFLCTAASFLTDTAHWWHVNLILYWGGLTIGFIGFLTFWFKSIIGGSNGLG
jgi:hypothetical protein